MNKPLLYVMIFMVLTEDSYKVCTLPVDLMLKNVSFASPIFDSAEGLPVRKEKSKNSIKCGHFLYFGMQLQALSIYFTPT